MEPSCLLGRANSHLLLECCAKGLKIRFQKPDIAAHHAEMGNLLSLNPKIHRLRADAKEDRGLAHADGQLVGDGSEGHFDCRIHEFSRTANSAHLLREWPWKLGTVALLEQDGSMARA